MIYNENYYILIKKALLYRKIKYFIKYALKYKGKIKLINKIICDIIRKNTNDL